MPFTHSPVTRSIFHFTCQYDTLLIDLRDSVTALSPINCLASDMPSTHTWYMWRRNILNIPIWRVTP